MDVADQESVPGEILGPGPRDTALVFNEVVLLALAVAERDLDGRMAGLDIIERNRGWPGTGHTHGKCPRPIVRHRFEIDRPADCRRNILGSRVGGIKFNKIGCRPVGPVTGYRGIECVAPASLPGIVPIDRVRRSGRRLKREPDLAIGDRDRPGRPATIDRQRMRREYRGRSTTER